MPQSERAGKSYLIRFSPHEIHHRSARLDRRRPILLAYALISSGKLEARSTTYQLLNIGGAVGFIVNSGWNGAIPSAALNVVWLLIGLTTLARRTKATR